MKNPVSHSDSSFLFLHIVYLNAVSFQYKFTTNEPPRSRAARYQRNGEHNYSPPTPVSSTGQALPSPSRGEEIWFTPKESFEESID
jgi:hypothetical protein